MFNPFLHLDFDAGMLIFVVFVALLFALVRHLDAVKAAEEDAAWERLWMLTSRNVACLAAEADADAELDDLEEN